jgi:imidazolonepropionase-like amidohydrolase
VEFGHSIGIPSSTHEIYPAAYVGMDSLEHSEGTSRRGYSPKMTEGRSYEDVAKIIGTAHMTFMPTLTMRMPELLMAQPQLRNDPRLALTPPWLHDQILTTPPGPRPDVSGSFKQVRDIQKAGGRIVAGTDQPDGIFLHSELFGCVELGMTPYEALRSATVTPAQFLGLDAGMIAPGKLADIVLVEGNPLEDIGAAHNVRQVIANGRRFTIEDLLSGKAKNAPR